MKKLIFIFILFLALSNISYADKNQKTDELTIGAITGVSSKIYKTQKNKLFAAPVIQFSYKNLYFQKTELGMKIKNSGASIYLNYLMDGYKAAEIPFLNGMRDRKNAAHLGVKYEFDINQLKLKITQSLDFDISNKNNGFVFELSASKMNFINRKTFFIYGANVKFINDKFADYYYGVKQNEISASRNYYKLSENFIPSIYGLFINNITEKISVNFLLSASLFSNQIKNSPIIDKGYNYNLLLFGIYKLL